MRKKILLLFILTLNVLFSGCANSVFPADESQTPSSPTASVSVSNRVSPTPTPIPDPSPTATPGPSSTSTPSPAPFVYNGLMRVSDVDSRIVIDQKYATSDNFTGEVLYETQLMLVHADIAPMLQAVCDTLSEYGYRLKIYDAYRPISIQQKLHDAAPEELQAYVPAPSKYSMHARGITVDVTLIDAEGTALQMPTEFDSFEEAAHSDYSGANDEATANRDFLISVMESCGFTVSALEWWHFDGPGRDNYEILDISFSEFLAAEANSRSSGTH